MDPERFAHSPVGHLTPIRGLDGRFNRHYDHVAFVADPLTAEPDLDGATWRAVTAARAALARLDQASRQIPTPALLRRPTLRREAQSTSALEGTFAPLEQVLTADADEGDLSKELQEILNFVAAANLAYDEVAERRHIRVGLLEQIHKILVRGTEADTQDAGRVRRGPVAIGSATGLIEDARFVPMPAGTALDVAARDLIEWIGRGTSHREPIVAAAMAHYQFETIHPFNDGNGRIGRLMTVLQFMVDGLLQEPLLSVSPWFETRRPQYQEHLAEVSATGAWAPWIRFFASGIESSSNDTARRVDRMLAVQDRYVQLVQGVNGRGLIRDVVDLLIADPVVTIPKLVRKLGRTPPAHNTAVGRLADLGVLDGPYGTYNRQWIARDTWIAITAPVGSVPDRDAPLQFELTRQGSAEAS